MKTGLEIVVLAAGAGTRTNTRLPKALHLLAGRPLLQHVLDTALALAPQRCHVVVGQGAERIRELLADYPVEWVHQAQQLGTGHAVQQALPGVDSDATVLVLYADTPLLRPTTLRELLAQAATAPALLTAEPDRADGYGRVLRDAENRLLAVVEDGDATVAQRAIREVNTGVMALPARHLQRWLPALENNNAQAEYYLPDLLALAVADGVAVATVAVAEAREVIGINDLVQLYQAEREYQRRAALTLLRAGVGLADARRLDVRGTLNCGRDVFIDVNVVIEGAVTLGDRVRVGANCVLIDSDIGAGVELHPFTHLQGVVVEQDCAVGPFARLRPETHLAAGARIGNFVETKKARIGAHSKVNHLSYIGDCTMGERTNIGAGTITCNYDGAHKHRTELGDEVFVGSNATLVAPLTIADRGFVAAGSTITKPVAEDQLALARTRQRNLDGWPRPGSSGGKSGPGEREDGD